MQLGYLHFEVRDPEGWHGFLTDMLGLQGRGRYRMDGHAWRFEITEGPADDLACVGWETTDLDAVVARVRGAGTAIEEVDPSARGVQRLFRYVDPAGVPSELYSGPELVSEPFESDLVPGGFVADELGLGHLVLTARDKAESVAFYTQLLGFKLSDHIITELYGHAVDLSFFHHNPRHHTVAFGGPQRRRLHHFMIQARSFDQVGMAYDRVIRGGHRIMQTLGRHPNDRMFSFYARTPSGFQVEFGWGGIEVDDDTWSPSTHDCVSEWGHHPPEVVFRRRDR
jgi:2,3-dihydroxybiphenyl 1,2-dioxygenase